VKTFDGNSCLFSSPPYVSYLPMGITKRTMTNEATRNGRYNLLLRVRSRFRFEDDTVVVFAVSALVSGGGAFAWNICAYIQKCIRSGRRPGGFVRIVRGITVLACAAPHVARSPATQFSVLLSRVRSARTITTWAAFNLFTWFDFYTPAQFALHRSITVGGNPIKTFSKCSFEIVGNTLTTNSIVRVIRYRILTEPVLVFTTDECSI